MTVERQSQTPRRGDSESNCTYHTHDVQAHFMAAHLDGLTSSSKLELNYAYHYTE